MSYMTSEYKTLFGSVYYKGNILQSYRGQRYDSKYKFNCAEQMDLHWADEHESFNMIYIFISTL